MEHVLTHDESNFDAVIFCLEYVDYVAEKLGKIDILNARKIHILEKKITPKNIKNLFSHIGKINYNFVVNLEKDKITKNILDNLCDKLDDKLNEHLKDELMKYDSCYGVYKNEFLRLIHDKLHEREAEKPKYQYELKKAVPDLEEILIKKDKFSSEDWDKIHNIIRSCENEKDKTKFNEICGIVKTNAHKINTALNDPLLVEITANKINEISFKTKLTNKSEKNKMSIERSLMLNIRDKNTEKFSKIKHFLYDEDLAIFKSSKIAARAGNIFQFLGPYTIRLEWKGFPEKYKQDASDKLLGQFYKEYQGFNASITSHFQNETEVIFSEYKFLDAQEVFCLLSLNHIGLDFFIYPSGCYTFCFSHYDYYSFVNCQKNMCRAENPITEEIILDIKKTKNKEGYFLVYLPSLPHFVAAKIKV